MVSYSSSSKFPKISNPAPSSPYYNALVSAYVDRASAPSKVLKVISTKTKKTLEEKLTLCEKKRRQREESRDREIRRDRWWEKESVKAGVDCTPHQQFLADDINKYTGIYKQR